MLQHPTILQELGRQHRQELLQQATEARLARQARQARRASTRPASLAKGATRQWWWRLIHPRRVPRQVPRPAAVVGPT